MTASQSLPQIVISKLNTMSAFLAAASNAAHSDSDFLAFVLSYSPGKSWKIKKMVVTFLIHYMFLVK